MTDADSPSGGQGTLGWFFNHLPTILLQRRLIVAACFLSGLVISTAVGMFLPTIYRSSATLLVQSQDLPTSIVDAPVSGAIEQRIARIRERVLSRGDLITLIEQKDLYSKQRLTEPMSEIVETMRQATSVGAMTSDIGQAAAGNEPTVAINMSFDYPDPGKAQAVLESFVSSFLQMDNQGSEDQARLSVRFLQDQSAQLKKQITEGEQALVALKARNGAALATTGGPQMLDTGSYSAQILALEGQNRQLLAQMRRTPKSDQVASAEAALANALATYSDTHPDVVAARDRLAAARRLADANPASGDAEAIRSQIQDNNNTIAALTSARNSAMARAQASMSGMSRAPAIMEQAMQLENRVSALRTQYNELGANLIKAQNSARMASEQRAERLSLVEPPSLPDRPHSPNRPLLVAAGAVIGLFGGLMLALLIELISRPLRSPAQLDGIDLPVLGVVPLISLTKRERRFPALPRRSFGNG